MVAGGGIIAFKRMKDLKKILFLDLPPALEAALAEQLEGAEVAFFRDPAAGPFDLVVSDNESGVEKFPGCPVLRVAGRARLGALLRQAAGMLAEPGPHLGAVAFGGWVLRPRERVLSAPDGRAIDLTDREAGMLAYLARAAGAARREDILRAVWNYREGTDTHTLETHIHRLRKKTGADVVVTDGSGYRLCAPARGVL